MNNLSKRENKFWEEVENFIDYLPLMRHEFFYYWTEPNKSGTKMKFELEKTWDTKRRLKRWYDNQLKWNNGTNKAGTSAARIETARKW